MKGMKSQRVMAWVIACGLFVLIGLFWDGSHQWVCGEGSEKVYVGSRACADCHETEYESFEKYAKKSHSFESIAVMKKNLTHAEIKECFVCHTTGYGKPGGFVSETETPDLKNAGCEVCHGPGSLHCETEEPGDIKGYLTAKDCEACHNSERVAAFNYKPLVYGGAH